MLEAQALLCGDFGHGLNTHNAQKPILTTISTVNLGKQIVSNRDGVLGTGSCTWVQCTCCRVSFCCLTKSIFCKMMHSFWH